MYVHVQRGKRISHMMIDIWEFVKYTQIIEIHVWRLERDKDTC